MQKKDAAPAAAAADTEAGKIVYKDPAEEELAKKKARAARFGMPLNLSEDKKAAMRAQRCAVIRNACIALVATCLSMHLLGCFLCALEGTGSNALAECGVLLSDDDAADGRFGLETKAGDKRKPEAPQPVKKQPSTVCALFCTLSDH